MERCDSVDVAIPPLCITSTASFFKRAIFTSVPSNRRLPRGASNLWDTALVMRVLITGITGFVGSHFAEYALAQGAEMFGSIRWRSKTENIDHIRDRVRLSECNLCDLSSAHHLLDMAQPDYIVHLAGQSFVAASWHAPAETLYTNTLGQLNLLEAVRAVKARPAGRIRRCSMQSRCSTS